MSLALLNVAVVYSRKDARMKALPLISEANPDPPYVPNCYRLDLRVLPFLLSQK
jgi:hypothetical protein